MGIIHHVHSYLQKPIVRKYLDAQIRNIVVLTGGKLTGIYFL
jgi:5,10-methylenetetrahydrofolate reductase